MTDASGDLLWHAACAIAVHVGDSFSGWCWCSGMLFLLAIVLQKIMSKEWDWKRKGWLPRHNYCFFHLEQLAIWPEALACRVQLLANPPTSQQKADHPTPLQLQVTSSRHRRIIGRWLKQLWAFLAVKMLQILLMTKTYRELLKNPFFQWLPCSCWMLPTMLLFLPPISCEPSCNKVQELMTAVA